MRIFHKIAAAYLKKNRARTIITLLGVVFSVALITAIATSVTSLQSSMAQHMRDVSGDWHVQVWGLSQQQYKELNQDKRVAGMYGLSSLGYAKAQGLPYLYYRQLSSEAVESFPLELVGGRMPQAEGEVLVPNQLYGHGEEDNAFAHKIGESYTQTLGQRFLGDRVLNETDSVVLEGAEAERFVPREEKTFTVVGVYESLLWESRYYNAPYVALLTLLGDNLPTDALITLKNPADAGAFSDELMEAGLVTNTNKDLLMLLGHAGMPAFTQVVYSLGAILILIVMFGSVLLIHNAFAISVSERTKQFGILASIGATQKQLARMVYYEAALVSLLGIVGGVALGLGGTAVVLGIFGSEFAYLGIGQVKMYLNLWAILLAAGVSALTVFWSARKPAARAARVSPIEAVRQTGDIRRGKAAEKVKTRLPVRGYEYMLANRNFKRNRRMYRSTVLSLFVSIVLFISASALGVYLTSYAGDAVRVTDSDFVYHFGGEPISCYSDIQALPQVRDSSLSLMGSYEVLVNGQTEGAVVMAVDNEAFIRYARNNGLSPDDCVAFNSYMTIDAVSGKRQYSPIVAKDAPFQLELGEKKTPITVNKTVNRGPVGLGKLYGEGLTLMMSMRTKERLLPEEVFRSGDMYLAADKSDETQRAIKKILVEAGYSGEFLYRTESAQEGRRALITGIQVFDMCFVVLITLVAIANIFNTVGTNVALRRREFATLKSMGMGERSFAKMLGIECLIYGLKALAWGLPCSMVMVVLVHWAINQGVDTPFTMPWASVLLSIFGVFVLVLAGMIYAVKRGGKTSIVETMKNENL